MLNFKAEIKGWGEDELAQMLGVDVGDDSHEHLDEIREALLDLNGREEPPGKVQACAWIRSWLKKLAEVDKEIGYKSPFFLGIASTENDWTLIELVAYSLGILWT